MTSTTVLFAFVLLGMSALATGSVVNMYTNDAVAPLIPSVISCSSGPATVSLYYNIRADRYPSMVNSVTLNVTAAATTSSNFFARATIVRAVYENFREVTIEGETTTHFMFSPDATFPPIALSESVNGVVSADDGIVTFNFDESIANGKVPYIFDAHTFLHVEMAACDYSLEYSEADQEFFVYFTAGAYNYTPALFGSGIVGSADIDFGVTVTTENLVAAGMNSSYSVNDYMDNICTCDLGIPDRACQDPNVGPMNAAGCDSGYLCMLDMCIEQSTVYNVEDCSPNGKLFGTDGVCNCGCFDGDSAPDLDCYYPNRHYVYNVSTKETGNLIGVCTGVTAVCNMTYPTCYGENWTCPLSKYNDSKTCECFCGVYDPDCNMTLELPSDCEDNYYCHLSDTSNISSQVCWAPRGWTSEDTSFDSSKTTCDCRFGVPSIGCYDTTTGTYADTNPIQCPGWENAMTAKDLVCLPGSKCLNVSCGGGYMGLEVVKKKQCDGGPLCNPPGSKTSKGTLIECECASWSYEKSPLGRGCASKCGDGSRAGDEECELTAFCNNLTCRCLPGHPAVNYTERNYGCAGCGNANRDTDEECDGGEGCLSNCRCDNSNGWFMKDDKSVDCEQSNTLIPIIVGGAISAVIIIAAIVALFIIVNHFKTDEQKAARKVRQSENAVKNAKDNNAKITFDSKSALVPQPRQAGPDPALLASLNISTEGGGMNMEDDEAE